MSNIYLYPIKILGILPQFLALLLYTEMMSISELAIFFTILATSALYVSICDFGFIRYSYRYIYHNINYTVIYKRLLLSVALSSLIMIPFIFIWCHYFRINFIWTIILCIAMLIDKLSNLSSFDFY